MKKFFTLLLLCVCFLTPSHADEGMWLPSLIGERIKDMKRKGFKLSAEDIYSINKASMKDAVVQFGGGCTGEFVSKEGLLLTNHHCGYGSIQQLSSVEHDYLTDGFWALSRNEELPVPGLTVSLLVKMEDVTDRIAAGEKAADIAKAAATGEGYRASVEPMYYGNQYFLFVYQTYRDVRLVGAPPSSIGKFGGDTDNWIWPRHTGDFSIFRVYAGKDNQPADYSKDNKPYQPKRHFAVSTKGVKEGDFTMIYGFPGNTQEYVTSDAVEYVAEVSDPMKIELRTQRLDIISAAQAEDVAVRILYASKHASIANAWKKWQGEVLGLRRLKTVESKKAYEKEFAAWAADKPEYKTLLQDMSASYEKAKKAYYARELFTESLGSIEALTLANTMLAIKNRAKSAEDLQLNIKMNQGAFLKNYNASIDRKIAHAMLAEFLKRMPEDKIPADLTAAIEAKGGAAAYVDYLYDNTKIITPGFDPATLDSDPMVELATILQPMRREISQVAYRNLSNIPDVEQWYRPYMRALREWDKKRAFYPDANFTLRVAYGSVAGYEYADGEYHNPVTSIDGIIAKDDPNIYDYNIPQSLRDIYAR